MKRLQLQGLLEAYNSSYPEEMVYKKQMLDFMKYHVDCFERFLELGHFTASAWILNKDRSQALLLHHAKLDIWMQLGGHCDGDSDVLAVAIKEAQEESGIQNIIAVSPKIFDIDIHLIPANSKEKSHYHFDVRFLLQVIDDSPLVQNRESKGLRWVGKDKSSLPTQDWSVLRMFDKWVNAAN